VSSVNGNGAGPSFDAIVVGAGHNGLTAVVRCALDGLGATSARTRETIETLAGALVVSAAATLLASGEDGEPRTLTAAERKALLP
jgi:succinate dehydrogenase/fumarate reductase flavoprotein subunit